jgi:hypothetical protein
LVGGLIPALEKYGVEDGVRAGLLGPCGPAPVEQAGGDGEHEGSA